MAISRVKAIKKFFELEPNGRKVEMSEMRELGKEGMQELGELAAEALGEELEETPVK